jgi:molecular chaperone GrpE
MDNPRSAGPSGPAGGSTQSGADRVVIKDKRKINVSSGAGSTGSATADSGPGSNSDSATAGSDDSVEASMDEATHTDGVESAVEGEVVETAADAPTAFGAELEALRKELDERTSDLQRVTAEYANYRKRVDRDRALVVEQATGNVLAALLPVLDDIDRAREHGDLVGPFGSVAEQLIAGLTKFGLTPFGAKGDAFDPTRHEAVAHLTSTEVTEPTCIDVMRRGYLLGERLLRPALVAVADPE